MKQFLRICLLICSMTLIFAFSQTPKATPKAQSSPHEFKGTIEGLVRDVACPIQNLDATATHLSKKCLQDCAKNGSPLVILTKDGELYFPISDKMPDTDQRQQLMPFLGKYVRASGTVYVRKGTRAIMINKIDELKDVHLTIDE